MKLRFHCTSFSKHVTSVCLFLSSARSKSLLTRRCRNPQDLLSHIHVSIVSFFKSLLLLFHLCVFLSQLFELVSKLAEEISRQSAPKRFQSFGLPANGNKVKPKISISPKSKLNGNNVSLICDPEKF